MDRLDNMAVTHRVSRMDFRVYSAEEIRKMSVKEITDPLPFDNLNLPRIGGLHDPALGCSRNDDVCPTCGLSGRGCPGHVGHIELVLPVFNPVFFGTLLKILKGSCMMCYRLAFTDDMRELFICQMKLLEKGYVNGVWKLKEYVVSYKAEKAEHFDSFKEEMFANLHTMVKEIMEQDASEVAEHCTKLVQDEMLAIMNDAQDQLTNSPKMCLHCKSKKLTLVSEYSSRIIARGYLARTVKSKGKKGQSQEQENTLTEITEEEKELRNLLESGGNQCFIMPHLARRILHKILVNDGQLLRTLFRCLQELTDNWSATDLFFISVLMVPPNHFRPLSVMGDRKFENPQTASLSRILADNTRMRLLLTEMVQDGKTKLIEEEGENGKEALDKLRTTWTQLQTHVNVLIDSNLDKLNQNKEVQGVRQILEKKEGLFRMHMMGKRVNYSARSVISPDVSINTNEIGLPDVFAQKLTYPQPVTPWNVHELRKNVINGPNNYPGASHVVYEDGSVVRLNPKDRTQREALAKTLLTPTGGAERNQLPKKVLRHVKDGDVLLLNRQPTLHRPSIQAHKARVLPGLKTLRLHYSSCKAYNADFDGDEMNAHLPQSELGRAEGYGIASTDFQYLVPKDGAPLAGLIQDHLVAGVILTQRGRYYKRDEYLELVHVALGDRRNQTLTLPPAIVKPGPFWTGKQVVSTVLLNLIPKDKVSLSMTSKAKIAEKSWVTDLVQEHWLHSVSKDELQKQGESTVVVSHGDLLQGVLDKSQCGPSAFGLVHYVYELYGGEVTGQLLTCLGRLFTQCLKWRGFTLGLQDFFVKDKAEKKRTQMVKKSLNKGRKAVVEALGLKKEGEEEECSDEQLTQKMKEAHFDQDPVSMQRLDVAAKRLTFSIQDRIADKTMGKGLDTCFPDNNLQLMVQSGAKGSTVNCLQVSGLLGQIELEGRRPPLMISGRSLPSFLPYDPSLKARGFVTSRFLTGITPHDFFPHCMAGREGLVDTAVKTSRSGYLQRCLIKHMEGLCVKYDMTVRDSDSSVIQFLYGEDGLEVTKTGLLNEKQFPFLLKNQAVLGRHSQHATDSKAVEKHKKKVNKWEKKHPEKSGRGSGFLDFCQSRSADSAVNGNTKLDVATGRSARSKALEVEWRSLNPKEKEKFLKKHRPCPDPVVAKFRPQLNCGAISDKMQRSVRLYQKQLLEVGKHSQGGGRKEQSAEDCEMLNKLVNHRVMRSLCEPGDPVGVLCAQSLGEQTTQMTLNTFHFAGRGEMNVTMGLPRLRELLMTASATIQTPCMDVPVLDTPEAAQAAKTLQLKLNQVFLSDVLQDVFIDEWLEESSMMSQRKIKIRFVFLPTKMYSDKLQMKRKAVIQLLEKSGFFGLLGEAIYKFLIKQRRGAKNRAAFQAKVEKQGRQEESMEVEAFEEAATSSDQEEEDTDGDSDSVKEKERHSDVQEYEGEEEEKEEEEKEEEEKEEEEREGEGDATSPKDTEEDSSSQEHQSSDSEDSETEAVEDEGIAKTKESRLIPDYSKHKKGKWCQVVYQFKTHAMESNVRLTVEKQVKKFTLQNVPGIKRCLLTERSDDERFKGQKRLFLVTDGVNMMEIMNHSDILDIKHMYTNSIVDIQNTFGIEAANKAIIKEVKNVFKAYNIQVDYRHLSLLADYMTCEGRYKGFSRNSITSNPSPLQKITFETSLNFLVNSCLSASADDLLSPSAQIVTGRVVSSGTGCFDIMESLVL